MNNDNYIVCLDLEGVLLPEIWKDVAEITGIEELQRTTRDEPDYNKLMEYRLHILEKNNIGIKEIQEVIAKVVPLEGANGFLDWLRAQPNIQTIILSDTFYEFAAQLMPQLGNPTLFCHNITSDEGGKLTGFQIRQQDSKREAVLAFRSLNFKTIAIGDSYNDSSMIKEADGGIFFRAPDRVKEDFPEFQAVETYEELQELISKQLQNTSS